MITGQSTNSYNTPYFTHANTDYKHIEQRSGHSTTHHDSVAADYNTYGGGSIYISDEL